MSALLPIPFGNPTTYAGHSGVDFPQPAGTPIPASGDGVVYHRNVTKNGGYQIWVRYDLNGAEVGYAHMPSHAACPPVGTRVHAGTKLGVVGTTGRTSGPHLHAEINGDASTAGFWRRFDRTRIVGATPTPPAPSGGTSGRTLLGLPWTGVQRMLKADFGYTGRIDNDPGKGSVSALQRFLNAKGYARRALGHDLTVDGDDRGETLAAVQQWLKEKWGYAGAIDRDRGPGTTAAWGRAEAANGRAYSWVK